MTQNQPRKREDSTISVEDVGFFEGAEKLLEIWFHLPRDQDPGCKDGSGRSFCATDGRGLRLIPRFVLLCVRVPSSWVAFVPLLTSRSKLEALLELVKCKIISQRSSETMDAYLLSESSLYVSNNRIILKTCGTTRLLYAIEPLIAMVKETFPAATVMDLFYSHRNFLKPDLQPHPHHSFEEEARYLDDIFEDGAAYVLGKLNGDVWYLYIMENPECPMKIPDQTLEILMMELDPTFMAQFSLEKHSSAQELTDAIGLTGLLPGAILDCKIFDPCGYSLNAIVEDDTYFTVHVTPQQECSFVSFETNLLVESYEPLISAVLQLFQPGRCTLTLFASKTSKCGPSYMALRGPKVPNYQCNDRQFCELSSYSLSFAHYSRLTPASANGVS